MKADWTSADIPNLDGKVAIVTGASSGLGIEIAKRLAEHGAAVVMACRSVTKGETTKEEVLSELGGTGDMKVMEMDVSSFESVRKFSDAFVAQYSKLDLLCCNAGIMAPPELATSADGFEMQFATNHLGHFLLVGLLLPRLKTTPGSRVVMHSSSAHYYGKFNWENLNAEVTYDPWAQYMMSKLANITFANELQERLSEAGLEAPTVYSAHPGAVPTNLRTNCASTVLMDFFRGIYHLFSGTVETGALPVLFPLTSPEAEPTGFYGPNGFLGAGGPHPTKATPSKLSVDAESMTTLWEYSEKATGFTYSF